MGMLVANAYRVILRNVVEAWEIRFSFPRALNQLFDRDILVSIVVMFLILRSLKTKNFIKFSEKDFILASC